MEYILTKPNAQWYCPLSCVKTVLYNCMVYTVLNIHSNVQVWGEVKDMNT